MVIAFLGQESAHCPQKIHLSREKVQAKVFSATFSMVITPEGQSLSQILHPTHFSGSKTGRPRKFEGIGNLSLG
jgi:hypothetical protein